MTIDDDIVNHSDNRPFADVLSARMSRRTVMRGSLATAAIAFFGGSPVAQAAGGGQKGSKFARPGAGPLIGFTPTANPGGAVPVISPDYQYQVLIPWGTPLFSDQVDEFVRPLTGAQQQRRVGIGHDGMHFFALDGSNERGVLCINHEYGENSHVLGAALPASADEVLSSQSAHGVTVVELAKIDGVWDVVVDSPYNRRITPNTPVSFDGPAADDALLDTPLGNERAGTLNNCSNGFTPWGTYLTCEENFNAYFGSTTAVTPTDEQRRYGVGNNPAYSWFNFDERWDINKNPGEEHRFGWVVEIDPSSPDAPPVKHTALGRVKHEGFAFATGRGGRAVGYMGDDQNFEHIYKFVSASNWKSMRARGQSPFSDGTLYVARFDDDGTGEWLPLTIDNPVLAERFSSQAEVLIYARIAATLLGATPMDRPEWTTVAPNGDVYCTLTNNTGRTEPDAANPQAPNTDGHIIRWRDSDDHLGTTFEWDIFVIASETRGTDHEFTDPDGLWADPDGRIFIATDGGQPNGANNQLLVADSATGEIRRLFAGVAGDEITGITTTPDRRTLFVNTQHPGNGDPSLTNFPVMNVEPDGVTIPRDSTIVITRIDGGIVGS